MRIHVSHCKMFSKILLKHPGRPDKVLSKIIFLEKEPGKWKFSSIC